MRTKSIDEILQQVWGYDSFRPLQRDIIEEVLAGRDTLGLMPTGGGKSITFQVPALALDGICIVVTPLVALMKDQVDNLRQRGIKAAYLYAGLTRHEMMVALDNCIYGNYKFLYVSPERLYTELFQSKLNAMQVSLLVVDEAHCISQWGYDFRPSYLQIADIREKLPEVPVLALTATATPEVVDDIQERLCFRKKNSFRASFYRPNLIYAVKQGEDRMQQLLHILRRVSGCAIVYVRSRLKTKEIAQELVREGISANNYHAGLKTQEKNERQQQWKEEQFRVMVATNAFGMGIDKGNVRLVIHYDLPNSPEEYYQEAGRAGRDGERAFAIALNAPSNKAKLKKRISDMFPEREFIATVYHKLGNFLQVAEGAGMNAVFDFNLALFCQAFKLPVLPTHHALKLLEQSLYLDYIEEVDSLSRVMMSVTRDELYRLATPDAKCDEVIQVLLRSYTGLFADYRNIREELLVQRSSLTQQEVYESLLTLTGQRILHYIPRKRTPFIILTTPREDASQVVIPRAVYEERKERFEERIYSMLEYVESEEECRTQILLRYFGETFQGDCGTCDICIRKKNRPTERIRKEQIQQTILELLRQEGTLSLHNLVERVDGSQEVVVESLRLLCDEGFIQRNELGHFQI